MKFGENTSFYPAISVENEDTYACQTCEPLRVSSKYPTHQPTQQAAYRHALHSEPVTNLPKDTYQPTAYVAIILQISYLQGLHSLTIEARKKPS
jgi:hypothetical protein